MTKNTIERIVAVLSLGILIAAWVAGSIRTQDASLERIQNISSDIEGLQEVAPSVYEGYRKNQPDQKVYIGLAEHPSYGGPLQVAIVLNNEGIIERVALVSSTDTSTYIDRVLNEGVLDDFLGVDSAELPTVHAITGATMSSAAIIKSAQQAAAYIREVKYQEPYTLEESSSISSDEISKIAVIFLLFVCAFILSGNLLGKWFKWNKNRARLVLLLVSTVLLGFVYNAQFSLSTFILFLAGFWIQGISSYAVLVCLLLALGVFLMTRKNLYCVMICPFGGIQEGLGSITNVSPPKKTEWMKWTGRLLTLIAMSTAFYFRNPSVAQYEPFSIAFSFIGSTVIFALTILIIVSSLFMKRPWCTLLCPIGYVFEYLRVVRSWIPSLNKRIKE